jgi:hypothetical protein
MMKSSTKSTAAEKSPIVKTGWLDAYTPSDSSQLYRTNRGTADLALRECQTHELHISRSLTD